MHPSRRLFIAGNWKMFHGGRSSVALAHACVELARTLPAVDVVVAPPYTALAWVAEAIEGSPVRLAAQNLHVKDSGPFTGEVSAPFLRECGCTWVIVGHSERRQLFGEMDELVAEKTAAALGHDLLPIVCVGETLAQRAGGETLRVVKRQVDAFLDVIARSSQAVAIAYEPVWAIGTGKTAEPAEAEEVHAAIRKWLEQKNEALALRTRILYGGSVKPDNAAALLECPNVDGALVGGTSLDAASFGAIARAGSPPRWASHAPDLHQHCPRLRLPRMRVRLCRYAMRAPRAGTLVFVIAFGGEFAIAALARAPTDDPRIRALRYRRSEIPP